MTIDPKSYIDLSVGQAQPFSKELGMFNTDVLFSHIGLGEGPVYRINPNGVQDIRIDNKFIDDLINEFNEPDPYVFQYKSSTGTVRQAPLIPFGNEITNSVRFSSPITLKAGQINGVATDIPEANLLFFPTSTDTNNTPIDTVVLKFTVDKLYRTSTDNENTQERQPQRLDLRCIIHPREESSDIDNYVALVQKTFYETIESPTTLEVPVSIPDSLITTEGYRVSVLKASDDSNTTAIASEVKLSGFDEIAHQNFAYPRTATIGYALKATNFRNDIPSFSSLVKGLIVKVPSNYNQPILDNGEVNWRELEVDNIASTGYLLQEDSNTVQTDVNPEIYKGVWDGTFKYDWTQNPAWIMYDILTNVKYGLGISEDSVDKYNFYRAAQFCDAVDPNTGKFHGVEAYADGSLRYKPRGLFSSILENQIGLSSSTRVKERRFTCDINILAKIEAIDLISKICASMRAILDTSGNKIQLLVDYPGEIPEFLFADSNMQSIEFSGVRRDEIVTQVEVVFSDGANNYEREIILVADPDLIHLPEKSITVELPSCSRRSQATRYAQYLLASFKYLRRKVSFSTSSECEDLKPGSIVSISTQNASLNLGYNGIVQDASSIGSSNVRLQHVAYPSISEQVISSNNLPLVLRHFSNKSNKGSLYLVSNTSYSIDNTGNSYSGNDYVEVVVDSIWNPHIRQFEAFSGFNSFNNPEPNDPWSFGEMNPSNYYSTSSDKLFRLDSIAFNEEGAASITATEYVSNIYVDSDTIINYEPTPRKVLVNPFIKPPPPVVSITASPFASASGAVTTTIFVSISSPTGAATTRLAFLPLGSVVPIIGVSP